jgi:hypothetical protein
MVHINRVYAPSTCPSILHNIFLASLQGNIDSKSTWAFPLPHGGTALSSIWWLLALHSRSFLPILLSGILNWSGLRTSIAKKTI